jgi:hypothetical protein
MTDTMTSQNIDYSSWDTLYIYIYVYIYIYIYIYVVNRNLHAYPREI